MTEIDQAELEKYNAEEEKERFYREGFSHGFEVGIKTNSEKIQSLREKIKEWRYELSIQTGAPGTFAENMEYVWKPNDSGDELDAQISEYYSMKHHTTLEVENKP